MNAEQEEASYLFLAVLLKILCVRLWSLMLGRPGTLQTCFSHSITIWLSVRFC